MHREAQIALDNDIASRIFIALDFDDAGAALRLVDALGESAPSYKIGLQLFHLAGPSIVDELHRRGRNVFLDVKFHDIPNTVAGASDSVTRLGVQMFNVHAAGGYMMMMRAKEAAMNTAAQIGIVAPLVIGVTQLTSTSQSVMNEQIGVPGTIEAAVSRYATLAQQAGLDGVVTSALELPIIQQACGANFVTVVPGIRLSDGNVHDQARIATPSEAFARGASYIVVGRAITAAQDPVASWQTLIADIHR